MSFLSDAAYKKDQEELDKILEEDDSFTISPKPSTSGVSGQVLVTSSSSEDEDGWTVVRRSRKGKGKGKGIGKGASNNLQKKPLKAPHTREVSQLLELIKQGE